jgi:uncharacterized protein YbaR (Trm112 family)
MVSEDLLALLVCPLGQAPLRRDGESLICSRCGLKFAIVDNIPNMLVEEAELPHGCGSFNDLDCVRSGDVKVDA